MGEATTDPQPTAAGGDTRRTAAATRRRQREKQILEATRALFDERGVRDVNIDDIARLVGTNRAILYRHFSGKEELFALTLVGYLDELRERLDAAGDGIEDPPDRLAALVGAFVDFGLEYPAFVDCAQALMRRPGPELLDEISESALFRLGRAIAGCLGSLRTTLDAGVASGAFHVGDTNLLANHMYATGLGALQLARVGMLITELAPGIPGIAPVSPEQVKRYLVATSRALATTAP
jgi:AcrR family transcriptional regulator